MDKLKSSVEDLKKRGYVSKEDLKYFHERPREQLIQLMNSDDPFERTASIITLRDENDIGNREYVSLLLERLCIEKALYTRLEICNALELGNRDTAELMCAYLGKIGNNQHKSIPVEVSKKKSFPLPRDIIARSLGKMNTSILSALIRHLSLDSREIVSELLDAIGFMVFYHRELATLEYFQSILHTYQSFKADELIVWKTVLCCSAFPLTQSKELIEQIKKTHENQTIQLEADRSLKLIENI